MGRSGGTPLARLTDALVHETGFAFGTPSVADDRVVALLPILRTQPTPRRYVLVAEAPGMVSATDFGRIDRLRVSNASQSPLLLLPGTLFSSDATATRATTASVVMAPTMEAEVEVKCVHPSQALSDGAHLVAQRGLAPARVTQALLARDQGLVWSRVAEHLAADEPSRGTSDNLVTGIDLTASDTARRARAPVAGQCGVVFIDSRGVTAVECFDSPESWAAASSAVLRRLEGHAPSSPPNPWTQALDAAAAIRLAKEFLSRLAEIPTRQASPSGWVALDASLAFATLDGAVVHLIAWRGPDAEQPVVAGTIPGVPASPIPSASTSSYAFAEAVSPYASDGADVAVAASPVVDAEAEPEPAPGDTRLRRRKVLTSGWDDPTFVVLDRYSRKEFRGDRSAAIRFLVRQGLRGRGYFGPMPRPIPAMPSPEIVSPSAERTRTASEARLRDLARIAEMPVYAGWLRKRARLELERVAATRDDALRVEAQTIVDRLPSIEADQEPAPEAIPDVTEPPATGEPTAPLPPPEAPTPPATDARFILREAFAASAVGDYLQAITHFDRVLDANRDDRTARLGRALALRRSGKAPEALADLDDVLRVEPRNAAALLARGRILQERGDLPDALGVFDLLVDAAPNDWDVWMARGDVLAKMNRMEDAIHSYRESLRRNPENAELEKRVRILEASHPAPSPRTLPRPALPRELEWGQSYLVREERRERSPALVRAIAALRVPVLVLTSRSRDLARRELGVASARILSLSFTPGEDHHNPTALASLTRTIERFIEDNQGHGVVLLDGLDELVTDNGFRDTVLCIERVHDAVLQSHAIFLISVGPGDLGEKEMALLARSLRVLG